MSRPLVIDSFAGGGGASEGIRAALGRDPDFALNHNRIALAMHRINHLDTAHIEEDVWNVDARALCAGRRVGLLWMSPDCTHFSKAKGGKPREKAIRGLAWVGVRWIKSLPKWQRPEVVCLENVEEFQDWGPLLDDGKPCPLQRGATFREFVRALEALGYVVEWRELRACDYGAPTIRKRLFLVARRDGNPIAWPAPTHGDPKGEGVLSGRLKPWRTAAEIIDWSLPCPSIFETSAEIKARFGIRANRPLADATMARIAKGTMRYVVNAVRPFLVRTDMTSAFRRNGVNDIDEPLRTQTTSGSHAIVTPFVAQVNHGGGVGGRDHALGEPMPTLTGGRGEALVTPFVTYGQQGGGNRDAGDPLHTICASPKDQNAIVAPFIAPVKSWGGGGNDPRAVTEPARTMTASKRGEHAVVAPHLIRVDQTSGDPARKGVHAAGALMSTITTAGAQAVVCSHPMTLRSADKPHTAVDEPAHTITAGGAGLSLIGACLVPRYGERSGQDPRARAIDEPAPVIVLTGNEGSLAAVSMIRHFGASVGSPADEPVGTITAGGDGKAGIVAAFLAQHNTERGGAVKPGTDVREPVSTITSGGGHQTLVAAHMLNLRGSDRRGGPVDAPAPTATGGGNHAAAVYAFLQSYYGSELDGQPADSPVGTETTKPRHGVVTVTVKGQPFVIVDIGMRMLTPRERFNAQGFRPDYVIDRGQLEDGSFIGLTLEQQGRACGNSVCPDLAEALVRANYSDAAVRPVRPTLAADMPLFPSVAAE